MRASRARAGYDVDVWLIDPVSGANLGADEKRTGSASVTEVQGRYAIVTVTGAITATDVLRRK